MTRVAAPVVQVAGGFGLLCMFSAMPLARAQAGPGIPADDLKKTCVAEHTRAQVLRRAANLTDAREALASCSRADCPAAVRSDCVQWLDQVKAGIPSVIVRAKSGTKEASNVKVSIDGKQVRAQLDEAPIEYNPGLHTFRFELSPFDPVEQLVLLVEGQKDRVLMVAFDESARAARTAPAAADASQPHEATEKSRPIPTLDYVLGGVAVVGVGGFIGFGLWGKHEKKSLQSSCQPVCSKSEIDGVKSKFIVADLSLATALAAAVVGGIVYVNRPTETRPTQAGYTSPKPMRVRSFGVLPASSGVLLSMRGEF